MIDKDNFQYTYLATCGIFIIIQINNMFHGLIIKKKLLYTFKKRELMLRIKLFMISKTRNELRDH